MSVRNFNVEKDSQNGHFWGAYCESYSVPYHLRVLALVSPEAQTTMMTDKEYQPH